MLTVVTDVPELVWPPSILPRTWADPPVMLTWLLPLPSEIALPLLSDWMVPLLLTVMLLPTVLPSMAALVPPPSISAPAALLTVTVKVVVPLMPSIAMPESVSPLMMPPALLFTTVLP